MTRTLEVADTSTSRRLPAPQHLHLHALGRGYQQLSSQPRNRVMSSPPDLPPPGQATTEHVSCHVDNHNHEPTIPQDQGVSAPFPGPQNVEHRAEAPINDNALEQLDNDASDPFASDLLWQASTDVGLHVQPATAAVPANVLTSDEPTLPNLGKKRPIDPDMDFLFETTPGEQDARQIDLPEPTPMTGAPSPFSLSSPVPVNTSSVPLPMASPRSLSGSSPRSPVGIGGVGTRSSPTPLVPMMAVKSPSSFIRSPVGQSPLRELKQEVASTEFSDVPLGETESVGTAAKLSSPPPVVTRPIRDANKCADDEKSAAPAIKASASMSSSEDGRSVASEPASSNSGGSDPGGKPDPAADDPPIQWPALTFDRKYVILMYLGVLLSEFLDLLLGFVYLATYHFGCYALVSPFDGGLDTAYSMFYVALVSSVSAGFFLHIHMQNIAQVVVDKHPGDFLRAILWLADSEWEQWSNGAINQAKLLGLGQLVLRDSLGMLVILTNLGPHDANVLTLTKLVLSSLSLARMGSHLFLAFAARVLTCGGTARSESAPNSNSKSDRMHDSVVFKSFRWILTFLATCMWLVVPLAFFAAPDELSRYIYIAESNLPTARIHVLCVPPTPQALAAAGGNPAQIPKFCNPGVCMHPRGSMSNYQAYDVEAKAWKTIPTAIICSSRDVPIGSRPGPARTHLLGIPGLPLAARFHAMIPCQPPITGNVTRLPANALWPNMFDLPYYTPRVTGEAHRANFTRWHRDVYRMDIAEHFAPTQTVHQYLPGDKVASSAECVRRWVATTDFYGYLDLVKGGLLVPEEVNVRYQTYTVAIEVVQRDRMAGPLACSFDYVGAVQRGVEVVSNKERLAKMGQDMARLLAAVTGRASEMEVPANGKTPSVSAFVQQSRK
ncbi:hypothetical protein BCR44DRAFT_398500 [Catenaria anguillulae PL171]|uniref:Uncharacterized protein n=1 Tax=Catenaria anguillulae PL171 TaxID=765915 RepID=A0A1Y2HCG0_9FUNG|nr:hypothetical protein BCR44DRAFT_398500 [Catenaria anguillulae PL171]